MSAPDRRMVLVSGGSRGLGLAIVESLLKDGERVVTFSRRATDTTDELLRQFPGTLTVFEADMSDFDSLERVGARVERELGPIDALVNNAGVAFDGLLATMPVENID